MLTVTTEMDVVDAEDGMISLREAIASANTTPGPDDIVFDFGHDGPAVIRLEQGELEITDAVTITGDGPDLLTIDAGNGADNTFGTRDGYRIFNIDNGDNSDQIDVEISGLTLTGGDVDGDGGAILNRENLTVTSSNISGNSAGFGGGGISSDGTVTVTSSTVSGNSAEREGGRIAGGNVIVTSSTISGNWTCFVCPSSFGGGIHAYNLTVTSSTISGNSAWFSGGGIYVSGDPVTIENSIVARNSGNRRPDLSLGFAEVDIDYSLISDNTGTGLAEAPVGSPDANGNLIGGPINGVIDRMLGALADNGGPTQTHALLPGSPAINAGDPMAMAGVDGVTLYDQRGDAFDRVVGGRIDMGAFEVQPLRADFDKDGVVDGADFLVWQRNFFTPSGATPNDGDADEDGDVDGEDFLIWQLEFAGGPSAGAGGDDTPTSITEGATAQDRIGTALRESRDRVASITNNDVRDQALTRFEFRRSRLIPSA